jgi:hypothetical protein
MPVGRTIAALVAVATFASVSVRARAEEPPAQPPPREYTAPLYQATQPSYVPQSVAMSGPRVISDWEEGEAIPPGYHQSTRIRKGAVIAGSVVFGIFYLISTGVAAAGADVHPGAANPEAALWIPGIGPFIQIGSTSSATGDWALAVDGIAQSGGLALLVYGIASPRPVLVRNDLGFRVVPRPMALGRNGGGFGLVGSF